MSKLVHIGASSLWNNHSHVGTNVKLSTGHTAKKLHDHPNLWLIDHFLSEKQLEWILTDMQTNTFSKSKVDDDSKHGMQSDDRTSTTQWFTSKSTTQLLHLQQQVCDLLGIFPSQIEPLQIVRYKHGQQFQVHHDSTIYNEVDDCFNSGESTTRRRLASRPSYRKFTIFIYLNTLSNIDSKGGETMFPKLNISVQPQAKSALLWKNTNDQEEFDINMIHAGAPFYKTKEDKGNEMKLGMNIWIHNRDIT